jgi:hypothetical protein
MGGAVVVHAVPFLLEAKYRVSGVAVLDVVEGTALDALPHMPAILNSRPEGFDSVGDAIEWQYVPSASSLVLLINSMHGIVSLRTKSVTSLLPGCRSHHSSFLRLNPARVVHVHLFGAHRCALQGHTGKVCFLFSPFTYC